MKPKIGLLRPFRLTARGDLDAAPIDSDELRESRIGEVLAMRGTSAGVLGELAWDHRRGNRLEGLRNASNFPEAVTDLAIVYTTQTLGDALPDEQLTAIDVFVKDRTIEITTRTKRAGDTSQDPRPVLTTVAVDRR